MIKLSEGNKEKLLKIIVILGIILSVFGVLSKIFEITIFDFLKNESEEYMRNSYNQSKTLFLTLSLIKGTMGVIEGSTLNANAVIGINLELGDIIEPVYEMINILWKISLLSVVILKIEDNDNEDAEEESYVSVEDEEILNKVFDIFKEKFKDDFDFVD